jgi:hypothetical protein
LLPSLTQARWREAGGTDVNRSNNKAPRLSLSLSIENLLLEGVGSGEVEGDLVGGELVVDLGDGVQLALNLFLVQGVNEDLQVLLAVQGHTGRLAGDRSGVALFNIKMVRVVNYNY